MRTVRTLTVAIVILSAVSIAIRTEGDGFAADAWSWGTTTTTTTTTLPSPVPSPELDAPVLPTAWGEPGDACIAWDGEPGRAGRLVRVSVPGATAVDGRTITVAVDVERGAGVDPACFAGVVAATLGDERGWTADELRSFTVVDEGADLVVTLATSDTFARLCAPLDVSDRTTCWNGSRVVLDASWWAGGAPGFADPNRARTHQLNHGIGLALGRPEVGCPGDELPAPVMMRQAQGAEPCLPNPWPADTDA